MEDHIVYDGQKLRYRTAPGGPLKEIDLTAVTLAEGRIRDVALTNPQRAPEMLATFNVAWLEAARALTQLEYEHIIAKTVLSDIKGTILLDRVPEVLRKKGLATERNPVGSDTLRQAVIDTDAEYRAQLEVCYQLDCARDLLEAKKDALEMAYTSVKKILGESGAQYQRGNPNVSNSGDVVKGYDNDFYGKPKGF